MVVALMLFARTVPMVALGALTGVLADRVDRRVLLVSGLALITASGAVLATLSFTGHLQLWHVAVGAFVNGCVWTMEHPVRRALISDVVDPLAMGVAISLDSSTYNGTRMVGPLAGGAVYAALGLTGAYVAGVIVYALTLALVWGLPSSPRRSLPERGAVLSALQEGVRYVASQGTLTGVMLITVVANLFGFSYSAMVPVVGERILKLDAPGIGALMAVEGLGASLGALLLAFVIRPGAYARVFTLGAVVFLCMVLAFAHSGSPLVAMMALFCAGVGLAGFGTMQSTILLSSTTPALRSRVMGVLVVCIGAGPLGVLTVGWLVEWLGTVTALTISSGTGLVATLAVCLARPQLLARFVAPSSQVRGEALAQAGQASKRLRASGPVEN